MEKINEEKFVPIWSVRKGKVYGAYDLTQKKQKGEFDKVKILSIKSDDGAYDIKVQFVSGDLKGEKDDWYLDKDENVFVKESVVKKKKEKLDEGLVMISSLLPVGGLIGMPPKREDNFVFKGLPGQFDEDGNKVFDENGQPIDEVGVLVENIRKHLENSKNKKDDAKEVFKAIKMYLSK